MNFDAIDLEVALAFGADLAADHLTWTWTNLADPANGHDGEHRRQLSQDITIRRGRQDETSQSQPASTSVVVDNVDGALTPRNPLSPWYPNVRRGTPLRVQVNTGRTGLDGVAHATHHASYDIAGDLDVAWDGTSPTWHSHGLVRALGSDIRWDFVLLGDGQPCLIWSTDGVNYDGFAPAVRGVGGLGRQALRATLDVDNGAGEHVVTFYTAPTIAGPWRYFDHLAQSGTTSVYAAGTQGLSAGDITDGVTTYAADVRNGIGGTLVSSPRFGNEAAGTTSFTDDVGRTWAPAGGGNGDIVARPQVRFLGNAASWAPAWPAGDNATDDTPADHLVAIGAAGILRRLARQDVPTLSLLGRSIPSIGPVAYWPLEGDALSAVGGTPATINGGTFGQTAIAPGSNPVVGITSAAFVLAGRVPAATPGAWSASFLYLPDGQASEIVALSLATSGTARTMTVTINAAAGTITMAAVNAAGTTIDSSSFGVGADVFSGPTWLHFGADQDGSAVDVAFYVENVGGSVGGGADTFAGCTCGRINSASIIALGAEGWGVGHLFTTTDPVGSNVLGLPADGMVGEDGVARLRRIAAEQALHLQVAEPLVAEAMGAQPAGNALGIMTQVAEADLGILGEAVDAVGLTYRPRASLYTQPPRLTLDARAGGIVEPFDPVLDDQRLVNEVALTQTGGPTVRAFGDTSEGKYDTATTVNVASPYQLPDGAAWRLHLGTHDGNRYPTVTIDLAQIADQLDAYCDLVQGDLVRITNLPGQHPPGDLDLIVEGLGETITSASWIAELACSPGAPWNVGIWEDPTWGRIDSDTSTLAAGVDADDTSLSVAIADGYIWSHADGDFDIMIDGEAMTVTAIAGGTSPQTFTVTRGADGVSRPHDAGASVRLAHPLVLAW